MRQVLSRVAISSGVSLLLGVAFAPAQALVDLNGPWRLDAQTSPYFNPNVSCIVDVAQVGNSIAIDGSACSITFNLTGTIDTVTGAFSAAGASDPLLCPTLTISGTATLASDAFSGTFDCNGVIPVTGPFSGGLCANGALDAGEDCDDANLNSNDCCSAACGYEPAGYFCFADGTLCTSDSCDGAGTCVPHNGPAGIQCESDGNSCTDNICNASGVCTHPNLPAGATCFADFNVCTDDVCDGAGACNLVNNTAPCDDWNSCTVGDTCAGGGCVPGAGFAPAGIACDTDFDLCTVDECDGAGGCQNVECSLCCGAPGCNPAIGAACAHPVEPGAVLSFRHRGDDDARDTFLFKWKPGAATDLADFGNPTAGTKYEMCIFDSGYAPQTHLEFQARAPAGGSCDGKPCWRVKGTSGFAYKDKSHTPGGLEKIRLKAGGDGQAQILVKGRGANLLLQTPYFYEAPLVAQVRASSGKCWQADFETVRQPNGKLVAKDGE